MTHDQFVKLERVANRAAIAAKAFATGEDVRWLNDMVGVIAEVRHASMTLSDPAAPAHQREQASTRLHSLFTYV